MRNSSIAQVSLSIAILIAAALVGIFAANSMVLLAGIALAAGVVFLRERISLWGLALILIGFGVAIGRLYLTFGPNPLNSSRLQQIALFILAFLAFITFLRQAKITRTNPLYLPKFVLIGMIVYLFTVVVTAVVSSPSIRNEDYFRGALEVNLIAPLAFFIAVMLFNGNRNARQFLLLCFTIGIFEAALALLQLAFPLEFNQIVQQLSPNESGINYFLVMQRVNGIWAHAPELGGLMALMFPIGIYAIRNTSGPVKAASLIGFTAILLATFATASLTSIVVGFTFALVYLALDSSETARQKILNLFFLWIVAGALLLSLSQVLNVDVDDIPIIDRVLDPANGDSIESSAESRLTVYQAALKLWDENPLWGVGVGQFRSSQTSSLDLSAHSIFLQALAETGVVGTAGLLILILSQLSMSATVLRRLDRAERSLYVPIMLVLPIILSVSILDFTFNKWNFQLLFWFSQGLLARKLQLLLARKKPAHLQANTA